MNSLHRHDNSPTRTALIVAFLAAFILLVSQRSGSKFNIAAQRNTDEITAPIARILSYPIGGAEKTLSDFKARNKAFEENVELRKQVFALRDRQVSFDLLELKVKRYERILSANTDASIPPKKIIGRVVSENNGPFARSLLLNTGTKSGVRIGNPVLTADGLIGHVINAGKNSSRILQLGDLNSRISIMNKRSEGRAILSGDNQVRPRLDFVQNIKDWDIGDVVITSGDDGMLPLGLPVGVVVATGSDVFRVKLFAENTPLDWVWVSPYQPIAPPTETDSAAETLPTDTANVNETGDRP